MFENERWQYFGESNKYLVSDHGRIKRAMAGEDKALAQHLNPKGAPYVILYVGGDRVYKQVNTIVASAFVPHTAENVSHQENFIWHNDGNQRNCYAENLKWARRSLVLEWNSMHRDGPPLEPVSAPIRNCSSGTVYFDAYDAAIAFGMTMTQIFFEIERWPMGDPKATLSYHAVADRPHMRSVHIIH